MDAGKTKMGRGTHYAMNIDPSDLEPQIDIDSWLRGVAHHTAHHGVSPEDGRFLKAYGSLERMRVASPIRANAWDTGVELVKDDNHELPVSSTISSIRPTEHCIGVPLEDLFTGVRTQHEISVLQYQSSTGKLKRIYKVFSFNIKPGMKEGTKIRFKSSRHIQVAHFIIVEEEHPKFERHGDDLRMVIPYGPRLVKTIDEREVNFLPLFPYAHEQEFAGLGMPLLNDPTKRGKLIIRMRSESYLSRLKRSLTNNNRAKGLNTEIK